MKAALSYISRRGRMSGIEKIRSFVGLFAASVGLVFIRSEQSGDRPAYPFLSYKVLSAEPEDAQCVIERYSESEDGTLLKTKRRDKTELVSLTFFAGETDYDDLRQKAEDAFAWVDSQEADDAAAAIGIGVKAVGAVTDRTVFLETEYEVKLGFDLQIKDRRIDTTELEAVDMESLLNDLFEE